ncbi:hypothetical protein GCK72_021907 [Caenorhabditis remanei]|uniref:Uncharacterized protein n=1 Tax=Caenorhabditis remanei TaxID=31234 RepID=A0A6A5GJD1_CAERE|nr:hypothetical protein GCK72_021907 [Caenorhabditis remanei]KAF1755338.1 hypothetical protein GCK72_021907 [Caenorhabditis remanei]
MLLLVSQILFSFLVILLLFYDVVFLIVTVKKRLKDIPVIYIVCMTICGIVNKISQIILVDGYLISKTIGGDEGYEEYRQFLGKPISLIETWGYLTPFYFNWLMTIHRVVVVIVPRKLWMFSDSHLKCYCIFIMIISLIDLLIPYFSNCYINFQAHPATWASACAPDRHPLTWFQNKYIIYFPVTAMLVNLLLIMYMKMTRGITNDRAMIRQVAATAIYLSIYEIGSLYIRLLPEHFDVMSSEFKDIFYFIRILTICSLNFFVYFAITRVTRQLVLEFLGFSKKRRAVATITICSFPEYRRFFGKQLSLIVTWGYLTPIYFNWLMTIHRVGVVIAPMKVWIFSEPKLMGYCIGIMILSYIDMLIPYFSSCSINFHAHPATWISACAPDRHPLTWFQNKYIIYFPVTAMLANILLIMYMKMTRGITNDGAMIRQVAATAIYLSIYEIGSLYIRLLPEYFEVMSSEFKDIFYFVRILTICSLNFFVYFVITRVTRQLVLEFLGFSKKKQTVTTITVTLTQKRIFLYSFGILVRQNLNLNPMPVQILCLVLLLIPYFSTCSVNFMASKLEFQTDCSPDRHPMTRITNTHLIWIPTTLLLINLTLVLHLKAVRHSVYSKMLQKTSTVSMTSSTQLAQCQKRREQMLMRQALAITVYLSFYEVGTFLMRTFPDTYSSLPQSVRDAYFYFRLETICAMNFFVYFMESSSMRKMLKSFLGCAEKKSSIIGRSHSEAPKFAADGFLVFGGVAVVCGFNGEENPPSKSEFDHDDVAGLAVLLKLLPELVGLIGAPKSKSTRFALLELCVDGAAAGGGASAVTDPNPNKSSIAGAGDGFF